MMPKKTEKTETLEYGTHLSVPRERYPKKTLDLKKKTEYQHDRV